MKKNYIIPQSRIAELGMQEDLLLPGSGDPAVQTLEIGGDDDGQGAAEIKANSLWDNDAW